MALTPYMSLDLPIPTTTLGPEWAEMLNAAIEFIDAHDHTSGKGRLITSAALNINDDVLINANDLVNARSYNMQSLGAPIAGPTDINSVYSVGDDLYYNDGQGNQIQITAAGALNASTIGGIGGDYTSSTANVYYNSISKTFFFDQNTNQRAKLDIGDLIIRETAVSANGVTIKSPTSLSAGYTLTLLNALPASTLPVFISNTGQISNKLIENGDIDDDAISTTKVQDDSITQAKIASGTDIKKWVSEEFTASGTWTKPADVDFIIVEGCGGGGGGGGGSDGDANGAGGGGGGGSPYCITVCPLDAGTTSYSVSIGAAGTGGAGAAGDSNANGTNGTAGGATTITANSIVLLSFPGGNAGAAGGGGGVGGAGGSAVSGSTLIASGTAGGKGAPSAANGGSSWSGGTGGLQGQAPASGRHGGGGGAGYNGNGGQGGNDTFSSPSRRGDGTAGTGYGSGGGGGSGSYISEPWAAGNGGDGTPGILKIWYLVDFKTP